MIQYFFSFAQEKHHVEVRITIANCVENSIELHLPMWRPGRYQLQNFAKNILNFSAKKNEGEKLPWKKTSKNIWKIENTLNQDIEIEYEYYANELNAGSSVVNSKYIYVNPVNLCLYQLKDINKPFEVFIENEEIDSTFACGLTHSTENGKIILKPKNYHQFFDCPFILSKRLLHQSFEVQNVVFNMWIEGEVQFSIPQLMHDLEKISSHQIEIFGSFPEKDYHFLLIIPENTYYHGVEHRNSTMMILGENGVLPLGYYFDLLGLASHELFHSWNICKIRPKELLPYDYEKENYFETCFVAEGFTTYYGDKILWNCGVIDADQYFHELETTLRRHFEEADDACQSLLESSFDLWVDGYEKGIPNKKANVYNKGALVALILDLKIRQKFREEKSLDDVMRILWAEFGNTLKGYTYQDIKRICEIVYEENLNEYFTKAIESSESILEYSNEHLIFLGKKLTKNNERFILNNLD